MEMVVVVCAAFGLTVSEAKTEIAWLRAKGMPESTAIFSVKEADQVYNQTNVVYLGRNVNHNADLSIGGRPAQMQRMVQLPEVHPRTVRPTERFPRAQIWMPSAEVLETSCTAASRGARARATTTRCVEPTTGSRLCASVDESIIAPTTRFPTWTRLSRREVRASRRL